MKCSKKQLSLKENKFIYKELKSLCINFAIKLQDMLYFLSVYNILYIIVYLQDIVFAAYCIPNMNT